MRKTISILILLCAVFGTAQNDYRTWLRGKVLYQDSSVVAANILNTNSEQATITDDNGEFAIEVKLGDELIISSVQYEIRVLIITKEILQRNRLVVDVNEKIQVLDEVVVSPTRQKSFGFARRRFKKFDYTSDKSTRVENEILRKNQLYEGVDFVNIFKLMYKALRKKESDDGSASTYAPSDVIRQIYPDAFFTEKLNVSQDQIGLFLEFIDDRLEAKRSIEKGKRISIDGFFNQTK